MLLSAYLGSIKIDIYSVEQILKASTSLRPANPCDENRAGNYAWIIYCLFTYITMHSVFILVIWDIRINVFMSCTGMVGATKQSGKRQAPVYSMTGRSKIGGFHEDLKKVSIRLLSVICLCLTFGTRCSYFRRFSVRPFNHSSRYR